VIRLRDAQLHQPSSSCGTARRYPLHRQHRICRRARVHIPVSTLSDRVAGVADRLVPLAEVLEVRVL
jgi:transposase